MPRAKKTLSPETASMEAGASYGEVSDNIQAQQAVPLPDNRTSDYSAPNDQGMGQQAPLPLEAAQNFTPQITPLTAPGENRNSMRAAPEITPVQKSADLLRNWAAATGDPVMEMAARQLGDI
jgi:hypothetical protein|tara:strand:+ start:2763 stop:3128 length:366 start_codon:yes stop_codon:yes gene_type:complete